MPHNRYHNPLDPWYVDEDVPGTTSGGGGKKSGSPDFGGAARRRSDEVARRAAARLRGGNTGAQSVEALERNIASRSSMSPGELAQAAGPAAVETTRNVSKEIDARRAKNIQTTKANVLDINDLGKQIRQQVVEGGMGDDIEALYWKEVDKMEEQGESLAGDEILRRAMTIYNETPKIEHGARYPEAWR